MWWCWSPGPWNREMWQSSSRGVTRWEPSTKWQLWASLAPRLSSTQPFWWTHHWVNSPHYLPFNHQRFSNNSTLSVTESLHVTKLIIHHQVTVEILEIWKPKCDKRQIEKIICSLVDLLGRKCIRFFYINVKILISGLVTQGELQ